MNGFDLLILAALVVFTAFGAWRGMLRETISLLTWLFSIALAWIFSGSMAAWFASWIDDRVLREILSFVLIFMSVFVLGLVVSWFLHKYFPRRRGFRLANSILGGVVGAARGSVVVIAVFLVAGLTPFPQRDWWRESTFVPVFERAATYVAAYIPHDIARHIHYG